MTADELNILKSLPRVVYSPGQATINKYGPLGESGHLDVEDIGSDEAQETVWRIFLTPKGQEALTNPG